MIGSPLSAIRLGNFKAFGSTQQIPLKPITLLFGPNSAGKSSLLHSLALVHEARRSGNYDVFRTDIGGTSIDLGGFRQYVFRRDSTRRVDWAVEIDISKLTGRLADLLAPLKSVSVSVTFGLPLDDLGTPVMGSSPSLATYELLSDNETLLRMSQRPVGGLRLDRLASGHPVFHHVFKAIIETSTTASELKKEDQGVLEETITELIPQLSAKMGRFLPDGIESVSEPSESSPAEGMLFPVGRGSRSQDLAGAVRFFLPRILNEIIRGLDQVIGEEVDRLQYLGPLRSYPPRHLAFSEHDDTNWRAGGGYAWDVLRRDKLVRARVNKWLGGSWLKTPYEIFVRELVGRNDIETEMPFLISNEFGRVFDELAESQRQAQGTSEWQSVDLWLEEIRQETDDLREREVDDYDISDRPVIESVLSSLIDPEDLSRQWAAKIVRERASLNELVLIDKRTETAVSHRDVGIGISQVLPVLVMAYGSEGKLLAIEQPEIHLHPALQAELGDVFIEAALGDRRNTFILETHSEHLILRLMRRMRETFQGKENGLPPLTPADISVLFVEPDKSQSIVREMPLNEMGELVKSWPGGFFEEGIREQFGDA